MSMRQILASAIGNGFIMLVLFFIMFPLLAPAVLWVLRVVLETINSI